LAASRRALIALNRPRLGLSMEEPLPIKAPGAEILSIVPCCNTPTILLPSLLMSSDEVRALRHDFNELRDIVQKWGETWGAKIELIHQAVLNMAKKTYVPGPKARSSVSKRKTATVRRVT
jgi:hypothetical protein